MHKKVYQKIVKKTERRTIVEREIGEIRETESGGKFSGEFEGEGG
jgi:hypothetical protein